MINTIQLGNCVNVMRTINADTIDLTVTSPPYDNLRTYGGKYQFDYKPIIDELYRITKPGGVVVWIVGDASIDGSETGTSFKQALYFKEVGFNLHDTMIYQKTGAPFPSKNRYYQTFEYMFVLSKGKPKTFNPLMKRNKNAGADNSRRKVRDKDGKLVISASKKPVAEFGVRENVWLVSAGGTKTTTDKFAFDHPAMFPESLAKDHILSWSNEGDLVLDPMCGAGTVPKMAKILNRNFIGIEMNDEYYSISNKRVNSIS